MPNSCNNWHSAVWMPIISTICSTHTMSTLLPRCFSFIERKWSIVSMVSIKVIFWRKSNFIWTKSVWYRRQRSSLITGRRWPIPNRRSNYCWIHHRSFYSWKGHRPVPNAALVDKLAISWMNTRSSMIISMSSLIRIHANRWKGMPIGIRIHRSVRWRRWESLPQAGLGFSVVRRRRIHWRSGDHEANDRKWPIGSEIETIAVEWRRKRHRRTPEEPYSAGTSDALYQRHSSEPPMWIHQGITHSTSQSKHHWLQVVRHSARRACSREIESLFFMANVSANLCPWTVRGRLRCAQADAGRRHTGANSDRSSSSDCLRWTCFWLDSWFFLRRRRRDWVRFFNFR